MEYCIHCHHGACDFLGLPQLASSVIEAALVDDNDDNEATAHHLVPWDFEVWPFYNKNVLVLPEMTATPTLQDLDPWRVDYNDPQGFASKMFSQAIADFREMSQDVPNVVYGNSFEDDEVSVLYDDPDMEERALPLSTYCVLESMFWGEAEYAESVGSQSSQEEYDWENLGE